MPKSQGMFAVIPARSGSSLADKNIRMLSGKTLLQLAVEEAKKVEAIDQVIVTSDSQKYLDSVSELGVQVMLRPAWASTSQATAQDVLDTIVLPSSCNAVVYLQPTSPLRRAFHIESAITLFDANPDCEIVSVVKVRQYPEKMLSKRADGKLSEALGMSGAANSNRQEFVNLFYPNGAIYILPRTDSGFAFANQDRIGFLMDYLTSVDIDTEEDLLMAEALLSNET